MKTPFKKLIPLLILFTVLLGAFSPMFAGVVEAATLAEKIFDPYLLLGPIGLIFSSNSPLFSGLAEIFLTIGAFLLSTSGIFFDLVIDHTIVNMSENLAAGGGGIGDGINTVWSTLRDLANMVFIFVLLWAAIRLILGLGDDIGKTIRNIVIVGLLINFSMFFTKVVIDASNIASIGFLKSINTTAQAAPPVKIAGGYTLDTGFSSLIVGAVRIQSFFSPDGIGTPSREVQGGKINILLTGLIGFILMLALAIVLLVASVLFVTRYILLIFIIILSPLALIGYALPALSGKTKEWWQALKNQAFFAPIFLLMLWVAFKLITTKGFIAPELIQGQSFAAIGIKAPSTMGLLLNFVLATGMIVGALILSKKMASSTYGFSKIAGGVATGAMGGAALAMRQTVGRYANKVASDKDLQERAARGDIGARMKLATAQKTAKSSFDVRGIADTKVGKAVGAGALVEGIGGATGTGGFAGAKQAKTDKKRKEIDEVMRRFRDKPEIIAAHLMRQKPDDQEYMYDKLSARDRAALEEKLDAIPGGTSVKDRLRMRLSDDEREKTDKAAKDTARDAKNKSIRNKIENLVAGRPVATNPVTGVPYTYDDLLLGRDGLRVTDARKLSVNALNEDEVIRRLSPRHLADIIANKDDLDDATIAYIVSIITLAPPYPMQAQQDSYINSPGAKSLWGIP